MNFKQILLLSSLLLAFSNHLLADDVFAESDSVIMKYIGKEIVIESFKQNNNLYIQPVSATLLTSSEIKESNIVNIKEFTAFVPNLFMPDYGSKMTSPVYIRGIGSRINAPSVALYVDGVPYFDRSTFDININDIDRIEVLRGPQGTIYGRNTMGGIINIYSKSPFRTQGTNLNLSAGNHNTYQTGVSHYGNMDNKIGYSISGNYSHSGGYFTNKLTNKKADPIDASSFRTRLSWRIKPRLSAHLILAYEYSDQNGYPYRVYDKNSEEIKPIEYNSPSFFRRNLSTNGLHIEYITDQFKLGSQTSFQFFDGKQGLDQDFSPEDKYYVDFYQRQQMYSQEFNIKSLKEDSKYKWQFGVFGFHQNYFQTNDTDYRVGDKRHAIQAVRNPSEGFAVYHQSTIDNIFTPKLSLIVGARYDWEETKSTLVRRTIRDNAASEDDPVKGKNNFSQFTPKASVQYTINNDGLVYFSVAKGYKTGGFNNTADEEKDRTFDPEHSWSYEIGAKSTFFNNLLYLDLSLFLIDWKDQQISQTKATGQGYILRNAGESESKGIELSAQINPLKNLNFQISYGYTHAKYKKYKESETTSYDNNYLPMVPKNTLSVATNYTIDTNQKWLDNIVLNAQYSGIGRLYWNDKNDISQSFYGLLNGKVSFIKKDLSIDIWTKNIASKDYIAYYFSAMGDDFVQKGKPFTCGINLNLKF
ncbi:MAG: TonB-dependent receptor [Dysgonomonas sp.]|nr:TonB-dependent receptor [Dysgonomonas sp.]